MGEIPQAHFARGALNQRTPEQRRLGAEHFPQEFAEKLKSFARRDFPAFKTREEVLAWLVKD